MLQPYCKLLFPLLVLFTILPIVLSSPPALRERSPTNPSPTPPPPPPPPPCCPGPSPFPTCIKTYPSPVPVLCGKEKTTAQIVVSLIVVGVVPSVKVTYTTASGYLYTEAHLYIGKNPVPVNPGGNPAPGQFPFSTNNGYCTILGGGSSVECIVPLTAFTDPKQCKETDTFFVAAHSAVVPKPGSGNSAETCWGGEKCIVPDCKPWARFFTFSFCCPKH
ncbi:hypothetical protein BDZ91DRAFT_765623 [Kalaharituber pfeilii]|nr:hypothetical protein BDZ91DRAFT_765623 [Kalaharituber pfeilii]